MKPSDFPSEIRELLIPTPSGEMLYRCLDCGSEHGIDELLYVCPDCGSVMMLHETSNLVTKKADGATWRKVLDYRRMLNIPALKGIYRYHEFLGSVVPLESVIYLGEGHTPVVEANSRLQELAGARFFFKNDGQNPSASFKDRGMASALSYINSLLQKGTMKEILAICASTGDTSAAAALYTSYLTGGIKSAVLLPQGKVTPQQLSQPLGSGARVFEIPGVFDDCMKVVEDLSSRYDVALLNSKNAWRILGQESYSFEIAQEFDYEMKNMVVVVPIGNAGNITAVMNGFLKFYEAGIIETLPKVIGVQSHHANPVYKYYLEPDTAKREFKPVTVKPSVAQAAMIGNPVSMPRVITVVEKYNQLAGKKNVFFVETTEQAIMDCELIANRNGHIACTQGGETLAGLMEAVKQGLISPDETAVIDSTAHAIKFSGFQETYFTGTFPEEFGITPNPELINTPEELKAEGITEFPASGAPLTGEAFERFVRLSADAIAERLKLSRQE